MPLVSLYGLDWSNFDHWLRAGSDSHQFGIRHLRDRYTHPNFALIPILPFVRVRILQGKDRSGDAHTLRCGEQLGFKCLNTSRASHGYGVAKVRIAIDEIVNRVL